MQISWQAQHFRAFCADLVAGGVLSSLRANVVQAQHFGWVESLSLWRGAHIENAKWALCALWVGRIALAVVRRTL